MLILRNIIITLLLLTLAAIAVVGVMVEAPPILNWTPDRINALGRSVLNVMRPELLLFAIWWIILLGLLLVFLTTVARPRRRMKIEVQMGGGRVVIMDAAIKKYIRNALAEMGEIHVKKIDLREHRNLVTTDITADVRTRENLPTLERRIISRVRTALAEDLGITNLGDVHVFIRNFEVTGRPIKPAPEPAEKSETTAAIDRDVPLHEEKVTPPINADIEEPSPSAATVPAASVGAAAGGALGASAAAGHALAEPIEPPGSTEPIVITDTDAAESRPEDRGAGMSVWDRPGRDIAEKSESTPVNVESAETDTTFARPADVRPSEEHKDIDHPTTWGETRPDDEDRDKEDRGPLPL